ncbi:MAG: hypothetical protein GX591_17695 [Planctomycetes bacterium]|nr:hypothetical protein [Planctomycetota bacterium]
MAIDPGTLDRAASAALPVLADAAVKGAVLLAIAGAAVFCMRRKASAAVRQAVWVAALAALLLLPPASAALPRWRVLPPWAELSVEAQPPVGPEAVAAPAADRWDGAGLIGMDAMDRMDAAVLRDEVPEADVAATALTPPAAAPASAEATCGTAPVGPEPVRRRWPASVLAGTWLTGTLLCLLPPVLGRLSLWRLARRSRRLEGGRWAELCARAGAAVGLARPVVLLQSRDEPMPMIWGLFRHRLLLPAEADGWSDQRRWVVLLHELAHAKRRDCLAKCVAGLACAVYWFNPLAWLAFTFMQRDAEAACDDLVLTGAGAPEGQPLRPSDYAQHLLEIASGLKSGMLAAYSSIAMARRSKLEGRLLAILDATRSRRALTRWGMLAAAIVVVTVVVPLASMRAAPAEAEKKAESSAPTRTDRAFPAFVVSIQDDRYGPIEGEAAMTPEGGATPEAGKLMCGPSVDVSKVTWAYVRTADGGDIYEVTTRFAPAAPGPAIQTRTIVYRGQPLTVLETLQQRVTFLPPEQYRRLLMDIWPSPTPKALVRAVLARKAEAVRVLLDAGADVNARWRSDRTALIELAALPDRRRPAAGMLETARVLIERGTDLNAADTMGRTALHHAAEHNDADMVRLLLDAGADPLIGDLSGRMPMDEAPAADEPAAVMLREVAAPLLAERRERILAAMGPFLAAALRGDGDTVAALAADMPPYTEAVWRRWAEQGSADLKAYAVAQLYVNGLSVGRDGARAEIGTIPGGAHWVTLTLTRCPDGSWRPVEVKRVPTGLPMRPVLKVTLGGAIERIDARPQDASTPSPPSPTTDEAAQPPLTDAQRQRQWRRMHLGDCRAVEGTVQAAGEVAPDRMIPVLLAGGAGDEPAVLRLAFVRFVRADDALVAEVWGQLISYPKGKWRVAMEIMPPNGQTRRGEVVVESSGIAVGVPLVQTGYLAFRFDGAATVPDGTRFRVTVSVAAPDDPVSGSLTDAYSRAVAEQRDAWMDPGDRTIAVEVPPKPAETPVETVVWRAVDAEPREHPALLLGPNGPPVYWRCDGQTFRKVVTVWGASDLADRTLPDGTYRVSVTTPRQGPPGPFIVGVTPPMRLSPDSPRAEARLEWLTGAHVTINVLDGQTERPACGVPVLIRLPNGLPIEVLTDDQGLIRLDHVPPGRFTAEVGARDWWPVVRPEAIKTVTVTPSAASRAGVTIPYTVDRPTYRCAVPSRPKAATDEAGRLIIPADDPRTDTGVNQMG